MTNEIESLKVQTRKGRGPATKPTFVNTSLRLPREVVDYFIKNHPHAKQEAIRKVLTDYVNSRTTLIEGEEDEVTSNSVSASASNHLLSSQALELVSHLADFLKVNVSNCFVLNSDVDGRSTTGPIALQDSFGELLVRFEPDTKDLYIAVKQFKDFCLVKRLNCKDFLSQLEDEGIFVGVCNKRMSKGLDMQTPAVRVLQFNTAGFNGLQGISELASTKHRDF